MKLGGGKSRLSEYQLSQNGFYTRGYSFRTQETNGSDSQSLSENPIVKKWWEYMSDLMETNPDNSPKQLHLNKVFSL